jgi:tetratricopeptide (TPR) repeat protein
VPAGALQQAAAVSAAAYTPDGTLAVVGCVDGTVRLWDLATFKPVRPAVLLRQSILDVTFTPDGRTVIVVDRAGRYQDAVARPNEAVALEDKNGVVQDWLFLAVAYQRRGQSEEARKWLDRARAVPPAKGDEHFWENAEVELLDREARALIGGKRADRGDDRERSPLPPCHGRRGIRSPDPPGCVSPPGLPVPTPVGRSALYSRESIQPSGERHGP